MSGAPPRWLNCPRMGGIVGNLFIPFKAPLKEKYDRDIPEQCQFHPKEIFDYCLMNKIKLGLVIDLTKTNRYYDVEDFTSRDCEHEKLQCEGHGETPPDEAVEAFINIVSDFKENNPGKFIGVHCTHGFNRTGFLICRYLCDQDGWDIEAAINAFSEARPQGIYKDDYLKKLYEIYDAEMENITFPGRPLWENEDEILEEFNTMPVLKRSAGDAGIDNNEEGTKKACGTFMTGIKGNIGELVDEDELIELRAIVHDMLKSRDLPHVFPGSQPVSLDTDNIDMMFKEPYMVSWKADGVRYMMLIKRIEDSQTQEVFMIDRHYNFFRVNLRFPRFNDPYKMCNHTLLDGEMVEDIVNGETFPRFLIFDLMNYEGHPIGFEQPFPKRLEYVKNKIIGPRNKEKQHGEHSDSYANEPFSVRIKDFFPIQQTRVVLDKIIPKLPHENDGLMFAPQNAFYKPGRFDKYLKWKPPELNSIDFLLKYVRTEASQFNVASSKGKLCVLKGAEGLKPIFELKAKRATLKEYDGKIVECVYDFPTKNWKVIRIRDDKGTPNGYRTAQNVWKSINDGLTKEVLVNRVYTSLSRQIQQQNHRNHH